MSLFQAWLVGTAESDGLRHGITGEVHVGAARVTSSHGEAWREHVDSLPLAVLLQDVVLTVKALSVECVQIFLVYSRVDNVDRAIRHKLVCSRIRDLLKCDVSKVQLRNPVA